MVSLYLFGRVQFVVLVGFIGSIWSNQINLLPLRQLEISCCSTKTQKNGVVDSSHKLICVLFTDSIMFSLAAIHGKEGWGTKTL